MDTQPGPDDLHVVIDTETTSMDPTVERIKSLGIAGGTMRSGITRALKVIVDTDGRRSSPEAMQVHRIPDDVGGAMPEHMALAVLNAMVGDGKPVIQNKAFDVPFLVAVYERQFMEVPRWLKNNGEAIVDTMDLARKRYPGRQLNLDNLGRLVGVNPALIARREHKHDVLEDCELTFEVWRGLCTPDRLELVTQRTLAPTVDVSAIAPGETPDWL